MCLYRWCIRRKTLFVRLPISHDEDHILMCTRYCNRDPFDDGGRRKSSRNCRDGKVGVEEGDRSLVQEGAGGEAITSVRKTATRGVGGGYHTRRRDVGSAK